jgi:protein TonB
MRYAVCLLIIAFCCDARYVPKDGIYSVAETMPEYAEGMAAFNKHIESSLLVLDSNTSSQYKTGQVMVSFIVNADGTLSEVKVVRGINDWQDEAALQAIKTAPRPWNPGINQGKPVSVKLTYPVKF